MGTVRLKGQTGEIEGFQTCTKRVPLLNPQPPRGPVRGGTIFSLFFPFRSSSGTIAARFSPGPRCGEERPESPLIQLPC